jgi:two-component system sensor histidine kinase KdpD
MPDKSKPGHGKHKIFLGFAPGVGKTYAMLDEAHRRKGRGQDVVVGFVESYGRQATEDMIADLEVIPRGHFDGREIMDIHAVIARKPELVIVDELAHDNPAGAKNEKRWQDVQDLLDAGINVLSTINVQHLESLNDHVADITGVKETSTVPDQVLHAADEVEIVDLTPRALINRLERGDVYPKGSIDASLANFFREGNLSALREIALREAATRVDEDVVEYRKEKRIEKPWATQDRVMICISPTRSSLRLIRRGWRMGQRMHGEVLAVHVEDGSTHTEQAKKILDDDFALAKRLGIETVTLKGDLSSTLIKYARERNITQIILGHPERSRLKEMLKPSILSDLARELRTVDIIVVATETAPAAES